MCLKVLYIVLYENVLVATYIEIMYYFYTEQVDFKISLKLILASKGFNYTL